MSKLTQLYLSMLKIGCMGFGGGTALIPTLEYEVVEQKGLISEEEFNEDVLIASITPGALPVEIAAGLGKRLGGVRGMLISASLIALPGVFLSVLFLALFKYLGSGMLTEIDYIALGISIYIIYLLLCYVAKTVTTVVKRTNAPLNLGSATVGAEPFLIPERRWNIIAKIILIALVFFLTGDDCIYEILDLKAEPIFDISAVNVLILFLFVVCYFLRRPTVAKAIFTLVCCVAYLFGVSSATESLIASQFPYFDTIMLCILMLLSIHGINQSLQCEEANSSASNNELVSDLLGWVGLLLAVSVPALILFSNVIPYIFKGISSAALSFGGGDAYLAVADDIFIKTGFVSRRIFYDRIVAISNAMPGSILCKVLACVGYQLAYNEDVSMLSGISVAVCGFFVSVCTSGFVFSTISHLYRRFNQLTIFRLIRQWIRPVISGLLLSVVCTMLLSELEMLDEAEFSAPWAILLMLVILAINIVSQFAKKRPAPIVLITASALISFVGCHVLQFFAQA